jgi:hypothetical protein
VHIDPTTLTPSTPNVFATGDVTFGPRNLIEAVGDGRRAAASIHRLLDGTGVAVPAPRSLRSVPEVPRALADYDAVSRCQVPACRTTDGSGCEVELGIRRRKRREAARCLQCFDNVMLTRSCASSAAAVSACARKHCIRIVDASRLKRRVP